MPAKAKHAEEVWIQVSRGAFFESLPWPPVAMRRGNAGANEVVLHIGTWPF